MKILVISLNSLQKWNEKNGTQKNFCDLTDEEFARINKEYDNGWSFDGYEDLIAELNADGPEAPTPSEHYIRAIEEPDTYFTITKIHRDDLDAAGFDTSDVTDSTMETLARKMSDDYLNQLYWTSLRILAEELGIPKKDEAVEAKRLWEEHEDEAEWETVNDFGEFSQNAIELEVKSGDDTYYFDGFGEIRDGKKKILSLTAYLPSGEEAVIICPSD